MGMILCPGTNFENDEREESLVKKRSFCLWEWRDRQKYVESI